MTAIPAAVLRVVLVLRRRERCPRHDPDFGVRCAAGRGHEGLHYIWVGPFGATMRSFR